MLLRTLLLGCVGFIGAVSSALVVSFVLAVPVAQNIERLSWLCVGGFVIGMTANLIYECSGLYKRYPYRGLYGWLTKQRSY